MLKIIESLATTIAKVLASLGMLALVLLSLAVTADVFMRYVFNAPINGVRDMMSLFTAVVVGTYFPELMLRQGNISIRFMTKVLGLKGGACLDMLANILCLLLFCLITWQLWEYTNYLYENNEMTLVLSIKLAPWWRGITIIMGYATFMTLFAIRDSYLDFKNAYNPNYTPTHL